MLLPKFLLLNIFILGCRSDPQFRFFQPIKIEKPPVPVLAPPVNYQNGETAHDSLAQIEAEFDDSTLKPDEVENDSFVKPIRIETSRMPVSFKVANSPRKTEQSTTIPRESNSFLVNSRTTTPIPDTTTKSVVQGFRVVSDPSNSIVFLDLHALKESGIDASKPSINIGANTLEMIDGLETDAPANNKLALPLNPTPAPVSKEATSRSSAVKSSSKPALKEFSASLKSPRRHGSVLTSPGKAPVFYSKFGNRPGVYTRIDKNIKASSTPSRKSQDYNSHSPVTSGFNNAARIPLSHASSTANTEDLSRVLFEGGHEKDTLTIHDSAAEGETDSLVQVKIPKAIYSSSPTNQHRYHSQVQREGKGIHHGAQHRQGEGTTHKTNSILDKELEEAVKLFG